MTAAPRGPSQTLLSGEIENEDQGRFQILPRLSLRTGTIICLPR
jgi:hypothetical protein